MSYSRSFTKRISVYYSGRVNYPASERGGSVSYSGYASEDVTVNIEVDTKPFDSSVEHCNASVGALTGAVIATEGAQVASIREKAKRIGQTVVDGFFKTVRSEISQQIMELSTRIEANLLHLRELAKRCIDKQSQMELDYNRISNRYVKIFEELNSELKNRIYELDRPVFVFKEDSDKSAYRLLGNDLVGTVTVAGAETSKLEARIGASFTKKRALDTLGKANKFLREQKETDCLLQSCKIDDDEDAEFYIPVCLVEMNETKQQFSRKMYQPGVVEDKVMAKMESVFFDHELQNTSQQDWEKIEQHFNTEIGNHYNTVDPHGERVRNYITRLFNNTIQTF